MDAGEISILSACSTCVWSEHGEILEGGLASGRHPSFTFTIIRSFHNNVYSSFDQLRHMYVYMVTISMLLPLVSVMLTEWNAF